MLSGYVTVERGGPYRGGSPDLETRGVLHDATGSHGLRPGRRSADRRPTVSDRPAGRTNRRRATRGHRTVRVRRRGNLALVSSVALVGVPLFVVERLIFLARSLASFAAGTPFGGTFLHVLPEYAAEHGFDVTTGYLLTVGILLGFVVERFVFWHHHSHRPHDRRSGALPDVTLVGDGVHDFVDGAIIAASDAVSVGLGVATTVAIAAHEIPRKGATSAFSRKEALGYTLLTALTAFVGGAVALALAAVVENPTFVAIPIPAGSFVYVAGIDLVAEFEDEPDLERATLPFATSFPGIGVLYLLTV